MCGNTNEVFATITKIPFITHFSVRIIHISGTDKIIYDTRCGFECTNATKYEQWIVLPLGIWPSHAFGATQLQVSARIWVRIGWWASVCDTNKCGKQSKTVHEQKREHLSCMFDYVLALSLSLGSYTYGLMIDPLLSW